MLFHALPCPPILSINMHVHMAIMPGCRVRNAGMDVLYRQALELRAHPDRLDVMPR